MKSGITSGNCNSIFSAISKCNSNIRTSVKEGHNNKALNLFIQMKQNGIEPNNLTFPFVAKACGKLSNLECSRIFHAHVAKSSFGFDKYVQTALVDMYVKCSCIDYAYKVFNKMPLRDIASWNVMILSFAELGVVDRSLKLFDEMRFDGIRPDSVTVLGLLQLGSAESYVNFVAVVHAFGVRIGVDNDVSVANKFISAYSKCNDLGSAEKMFYRIDSNMLTVISWNSMISGYSSVKKSYKAVDFYLEMLGNGFKPDISTILNLLSSCVKRDELYQGKMIHSHGIQMGCDLDITVVNTTISMYSKCGDICSARSLFDSMIGKNCVSYTCMIGGYAENGDLDEALALFNLMKAENKKPDTVTLLHLISICGQTGAFETGKVIEDCATLHNLKSNVLVSNALIDMYAKCGRISDSCRVFDEITEKTIVSWTSMIMGFALNGEFEESLKYFDNMLENRLRPNHLTFLAVLQACNHAGFLQKGLELFDIMSREYNLNPWVEHYSCIADLFGRKGNLKESFSFIQNMPMKPDAGIWGSLLSSCKIHRNVEIGEYAARRLIELEPRSAAPYVEIANVYACAGMWDGVAAVRNLMKSNQVVKFPGQSSVEVNGEFHHFTVDDGCHSENLVIHDALDSLYSQLKDEVNSFFWEECLL